MNTPKSRDEDVIPVDAMTPIVHGSTSEERIYRKKMLVIACQVFGNLGFNEGSAGHITVRDPEYKDHFWINPCRTSFELIRVDQLLLVNHQGAIIEGEGLLNKAALSIHREIYNTRPDVISAAHAHSLYGKAWSSHGRLIDPLTQDACVFYNDHTLFDEYTGPVLDDSEAKRICATLGQSKACILKNHGLLTVGSTVESAAWWLIAMERCCQVQLLAESTGTPVLIAPEVATKTREILGTEKMGWFNFQPLSDQILYDKSGLLN